MKEYIPERMNERILNFKMNPKSVGERCRTHVWPRASKRYTAIWGTVNADNCVSGVAVSWCASRVGKAAVREKWRTNEWQWSDNVDFRREGMVTGRRCEAFGKFLMCFCWCIR